MIDAHDWCNEFALMNASKNVQGVGGPNTQFIQARALRMSVQPAVHAPMHLFAFAGMGERLASHPRLPNRAH